MTLMQQTKSNSTPSYCEFDPRVIKYQYQVIKDINSFDYKLGTHELLLSGSVGSAKSILMAHIAVHHCVSNNSARVMLGRKALPDLKDTIFLKILEHLEDSFEEGEDYTVNNTQAEIKFANGSEIISRSWADRKYKKIRSIELSMAVFEELTENDDQDKTAYLETKMRVGRLPHVKKPIMISATNPDSPAHWVYGYFMANPMPTKHVYYSITTDNPFLPPQYIEQLQNDLDPKLARRMIYGEWIEIAEEVVYYAYSRDKNFKDYNYEINPHYPIYLSWDFNIGAGKPLSVAVMQFIRDKLHIFDEVVVEGMRTLDSLEELADRGILDLVQHYVIAGDATGKHKDTRNVSSDYDIIKKYLANFKNKRGQSLILDYKVPISNPPIRKRHNLVNAYCCNANGEVRLFVYKKAKTADEGLRLTQLKKGGSLVEDDSKPFQHITTAIGYSLYSAVLFKDRKKQGTVIL